ncbi:hypothetical protein BHM03_00045006 [Ensete ventricosum]|nr:hypothetical protein BHM03_00045006 [Ensete ventricosum]
MMDSSSENARNVAMLPYDRNPKVVFTDLLRLRSRNHELGAKAHELLVGKLPSSTLGQAKIEMRIDLRTNEVVVFFFIQRDKEILLPTA